MRLEFHHTGSEIETADFVSCVNRALDSCNGKYYENFVVRFNYYECFASDVDAWIEFCVKNDVKNFSLAITKNHYKLPPPIMHLCSSLMNLHLERCIMPSKGTIGWKNLTKLSITEVELNQSVVDEILSGCPVLHDLELLGCRGFDRLEVDNACVETLKIEECSVDDAIATPLEISAPYVHTLDIKVFPQRRKLLLNNISSVVAAFINFFEYDVGSGSEQATRNAKEFLEKFVHVNKIHLSRLCFEVVSMMAVNGWQLRQFRHEHLTLVSCIGYEHCVPGIIALLKSSPDLETLVLEGYGTETKANPIVVPSTKVDLDDDLFHLKTVKFGNFTNRYGEPMVTLAEILLKRAVALEEMAIEMDVQDTWDKINIYKSLFRCCRSSPKAIINVSRYLRDE